MLMAWLSTRGLHKDARSTIARVGTSKAYEEDFSTRIKKPVSFSPWNACFLFWFRGHLLSYRSGLKDDGFHKVEEISITCAGRSPKVLQDFMLECREEYMRTVENKTVIFENCGGRWRKATEKRKRSFSTVLLSRSLKEELIADVKQFVDQDTRQWFAEKSMPYRRGYLLHGPPGTGKTSFSFALAGDLDIDLYTLSLPDTNDDTLKTLFADLPPKCVVLLEDIDAVGLHRSTHPNASDKESSKRDKGPTFSGLLNTLDGVGSKEGRILIMTTNHVETLDDALIRAGRVDKMAEFELADASVISQLFGFIFGHSEGVSENDSCESTRVGQLAADFVDKVPDRRFSTAEILGHLLQYRQSPDAAVSNVETWATALLRDKENRTANYSYHGYRHPQRETSSEQLIPIGARADTLPSDVSTVSSSSFLARELFSPGLDAPCHAGLSISAVGERVNTITSCMTGEPKALSISTRPRGSSQTDVKKLRKKNHDGRDFGAHHDFTSRRMRLKCHSSEQGLELFHSHTTLDIDEPGSPRPLLAPSPSLALSPKLENAGDSCTRAKIDLFSNASGRTTPEEGLWMRRRERNEHFVEMQEALYNLSLEE